MGSLTKDYRSRLHAAAALLGALLLLAAPELSAQDSGGAGSSGGTTASGSDDALFGAETVTEAKTPDNATPQNEFLKYEQVKVGGLVTGNLGYTATWLDPWKTTPDLSNPDKRSLDPALLGRIRITAKPSTDFGVNMEFRTQWPFFTKKSFLTGATYYADNPLTIGVTDPGLTTKTDSVTQMNVSLWSLYSKFSWNDALFFSFGKQPLSWGVSKSFFQPADDIFALTPVDFTDTSAEREGPIVFKAHYPIPKTLSNLYFYAGIPDQTSLDIPDLRLATKAEFSTGNLELAAGAYYSQQDHARALLMGTTGTGDFNFFGEAVAKYGSERYFLAKNALGFLAGTQKADQPWFAGSIGGYYINTDSNITVMASYFYNGEGQTGVTAQEAYEYFFAPQHQSEIDRMHFGTHYAAFSFSKTKLFNDNFSVLVYGVGNLSDLSFMVAPSLTWRFFDWASVKLGGTLTFGDPGTEYTMMGGGKPSASANILFTLGTGAF